ncbi:hypothetical protein SAY87_021352 [Trapa incisa]|uniref:Uncharacterized protein n=1 Tax=Trapa incisa TaxID=236973 RepID=A0AAN7PR75_9MYRT|nr:hypothetical protein SAY87_021352 [Trapa incisa]
MDSLEAKGMKEDDGPINSNLFSSDGSDLQARERASLIGWLNSSHPDLKLHLRASDEELRSFLLDGTFFIHILKLLRPDEGDQSPMPQSEGIRKFVKALGEMDIPRFSPDDLEKGSMKPVIECLLSVRTHLLSSSVGEDRRKILSKSKSQRSMGSPVLSEPSPALLQCSSVKLHEVFQLKQGQHSDISPTQITEMMKLKSLDSAPTQSLLSLANGILGESNDWKNGQIPQHVASLLRNVVQEIERRISTHADHLKTQNNLFKAREEKYQSRIKVLETLAEGVPDEIEVGRGKFRQIKAWICCQADKEKIEDRSKLEEEEFERLKLLKERGDQEMLVLRREFERLRLEKERENEESLALKQDFEKLKIEKERGNHEMMALKQELDVMKKTVEIRCQKMEAESEGSKVAFDERVKELEQELAASKGKLRDLEASTESTNKMAQEQELQLKASRKKVKQLEMYSESKDHLWQKKELTVRTLMDSQFHTLQELRLSSNSIKQDVLRTHRIYSEEFNQLGVKFKPVAEAAQNYHAVLMENRRLFNEVQDLKGNIRVFCRIRPFIPGQAGRETILEHIGDDGELTVANPSKPGKEGHRMFKFTKVFGPDASQVDVYSDIQAFIRSVLDGYNVCIFAYGQTGSGKTYTMTGPNLATEATWGVNYRALNDLFQISETRSSTIKYEILVQMVEIYNEQIRDLLSTFLDMRTLGISTASQSSGLAVPDASMHPVRSTSDVMDLMDIGFKNRAVSATSMNERSSRSHSILTIHVRGNDLKTGSALHGNLHLVDLAGSERVDRSEVVGDRLREAQHINKSLSALGDVIFALAQKGAHIPYRNSKLTQVLQSSLGGQAKTLMFVQLNPDNVSYSESLSTLKFAERVSGVELGAARSSKEGGRDVRELLEQVVASLKETASKREEEIERLKLLGNLKSVNHDRYGSSLSLSSDGSNLVGGSEDYEGRTSSASEAEDEGLADVSVETEHTDSIERPKAVSKVTRPSVLKSVHSSSSLSSKVSAGIKKPVSGSSTMLKPSRRRA